MGDPRLAWTRDTQKKPDRIKSTTCLYGLRYGSTAMKPVTDFGFVPIRRQTRNDFGIYGMSACVYPSISSCLRDCPMLVRNDVKHKVFTNYRNGRVNGITVRLKPIGEVGRRMGLWSLLLVPYRVEGDAKVFEALKNTPVTLGTIKRYPGVVMSQDGNAIETTFKPSIRDGYIYQFNDIEATFCAILLVNETFKLAHQNTGVTRRFPVCALDIIIDVQLGGSTIRATEREVESRFKATGVDLLEDFESLGPLKTASNIDSH